MRLTLGMMVAAALLAAGCTNAPEESATDDASRAGGNGGGSEVTGTIEVVNDTNDSSLKNESVMETPET